MSSKVTRAAALALAGAAGAVVAMTAVSPATAAHARGPQPVSNRLTAVQANASSWVNIYWRTDSPVCAARVQVDGGRQVAVSYPGMRRTTTFTRGDVLRPGRIAATPIQVRPLVRSGGVVVMRAVMSYTDCVRHARTQFRRVSLALPVIRNIRPSLPGHQFPGHQVPGHQVPGHQVPGHQVPGHQVPGHQVPGQQVPGHQVPGNQGTPGHQIPGSHAGQPNR
jgi:hypothetical protein